MTMSKSNLLAAAMILAFSAPVFAADAMTKDQVKTERDRIAAELKANKAKCKDLKGNAKDVCTAEAQGQEKVSKAELAAKQNDTPKNRYDVAAAKADMQYRIAKEKCEDMKGDAQKACDKDAKATRDQTKNQAKAERDAADGNKVASRKTDTK
jgi:hypothetical protein